MHSKVQNFKSNYFFIGNFVLLAFVSVTLVMSSTALASDDFYTSPNLLPSNNGDLIKQERSDFFLDPLRAISVQADVFKIMYKSTNHDNASIAVTGTVIVPYKHWHRGPRPLVAYAVGTQGLADRCAPSRQLAAGSEYEGVFIAGLIARGYAVVVTDYEGLGTEGVHTYINRESAGRTVLDSLRAAQQLGHIDIPAAGPVAISGYSQGGGAAASAAELAPSYAPELDLKGVVAGAVPSDLALTAKSLDGSFFGAFVGYAMAGLRASYDLDFSRILNKRGLRTLKKLERQCLQESVLSFPFLDTKKLTLSGQDLNDIINTDSQINQLVQEQVIGQKRRPKVPVLLTHSVLDDVIPYKAGRDLARRWCRQGADVQFASSIVPTHIGGAIPSYAKAFRFLERRMSGKRFRSQCWTLRF
ncbi:MAG: lipase family protein [Glaciecola sp.]